jgi:RNA polymerase sigma-70 factor, ECF subfamily
LRPAVRSRKRQREANINTDNFRPIIASMLEQLKDESFKRYQEYLLGGLDARQRKGIAQQILTNEHVFNDLRAAEEALIDGYCDDTLPAPTRERLATILASSKVWQRKIGLARALRTIARRNAKPDPTKSRNELFENAMAELEQLATKYLTRQRPGTFEPSDLVNEAYLRIRSQPASHDLVRKEHFMALASQTMRRVLVDYARAASSAKRAGNMKALGNLDFPAEEHDADSLLDLDFALLELATKDARQSRLVELIFFGGLSLETAAESLGISTRTAKRDWATARAWLQGRMRVTRHVN